MTTRDLLSSIAGATRTPLSYRVASDQRRTVDACPICISRRLHYAFSQYGYRVVRCADCGLLLLNPQPSDAELAAIYSTEYFLGDDTPADVFLSQSPGPTALVASGGNLAELDDAVLEMVDERWRGDGGRWVGVTARQRVLVYNTELVDADDLPDSVFDLVDPAYEGEVAVAPTNASFQDFVTAMRGVEGEAAAREWLEGMADNDSPAYADNASIVAAVGRGEIPMGLVNHYYNYRALEEDPSLPTRNYVFPDGDLGSLLIDSTVAILESGEHRDDAARFVEFLLSAEAQEYFSRETFEYPLAPGASPAPELPPLDVSSGPAVDLTSLGDLRETAQMIAGSGLL
jgi:iron(III) transport system substrate-binding protein